MMGFSNTKTSSMILLSVLIPVSLLATFRIAGIIPEPLTPLTITIEPVVWTHNRPRDRIIIDSKVENVYESDGVSIGLGAHVYQYDENYDWWYFGIKDYVDFRVHVNASIIQGLISDIVIKYYPIDAHAKILVSNTFLWTTNASIIGLEQTGTNLSIAYVKAKALGSSCSVVLMNYWLFLDENLEDHQIKVTLEVAYSTGITAHKIVLPIILEMPVQTQSIGG